MSIAIWAATVIANVMLVLAIVRKRSWKVLPLFSTVQFIGLTFSAIQIFMYFSPLVPNVVYHSFWLYTDQLFILLESFSIHEIISKCRQNILCWAAGLAGLHVLLKFHEYILSEAGIGNHRWYVVRVTLNLILTLLMAWCMYAVPEEIPTMSTQPQPPLPPPPEEPQPDTDTGAPPNKP